MIQLNLKTGLHRIHSTFCAWAHTPTTSKLGAAVPFFGWRNSIQTLHFTG